MSESGQVRVRTFCFEQDYEQVRELWAHAGSGVHLGRSDTPEEIRKKLDRDPDLFLVAERDACIIGAVLGGFDGRRGMVYHLAVAQDQRQNGTGSLLMAELEARMRQKGCLRSYLLVTPENLEAMDFYERRGWERMPLAVYGKDIAG